MPSDFRDLSINIVASLVWLLLGITLRILYELYSKRRPIARIWGLRSSKKDLSIAVSTLTPQKTGEYRRPMTGLGELQSVSFIRESLIEAYGTRRTVNICFSDRFPEGELLNDVISIGGTDHNHITRYFSKIYELPVGCEDIPHTVVVDRALGKTYTPVIENSEIKIDYGIVSRIPNPLNPKNVVILIDGSHTYGLAGAARLMTEAFNEQLIREIKRTRSPYWQAVVLTRTHGAQEFPELVGFTALSALKKRDPSP